LTREDESYETEEADDKVDGFEEGHMRSVMRDP